MGKQRDSVILAMSSQVEQTPAEPEAPALPDYLTDPDAVMKDAGATWRYGKPPDYSNTRKVWSQSECDCLRRPL